MTTAEPVRQPRAPRTALATGSDVTALRQEIASIRTELIRLRQQRPGDSAPAGVAEERPQIDAASRVLAQEEAAQRRQMQLAALDAAFSSQSVNPQWSASTSSLIQNALDSDEVGHIRADRIDCRSESCRVELHGDLTGSLAKSVPILAIQVASALPAITANNVGRPDGSSTVILYLSRQGR
jgi:hypothetical protein